jgi:isopenicillin N synthase-like dioxygenase
MNRDSLNFTDHDIIWEHTRALPGFRETAIDFYTRRLTLARKLVRIFALALSLDESYFDDIVTHPTADDLYIHYPGTYSSTLDAGSQHGNVGIGSHTDIQCFTLLWQDNSGGLQVLSRTDEWLDAAPKTGTLVVNVGDFLQRLSNDRFKSTVHRVYNRQKTSRYSMPFFMGFNEDAVCRVVPSCVGEEGEKYGPISCGEWRRQRFTLARVKRDAM